MNGKPTWHLAKTIWNRPKGKQITRAGTLNPYFFRQCCELPYLPNEISVVDSFDNRGKIVLKKRYSHTIKCFTQNI